MTDYFNIIEQIFSKEGFAVGPIKIRIDQEELIFRIKKHESGLSIKFQDNCPKIKIKNIISVNLIGIHLSKTGGVLEIDNFPDLPFSYQQFSKYPIDND